MTKRNEYIAIEVNGEAISLEDVLRSAKWREQLGFIRDAVNRSLVRKAAERRRVEVSDEELQQAADDFRARHELHEVTSTQQWLETRHLSFEDWEMMLEEEVIAGKLRDALTEGKVEQYFAHNKLSFDAAIISHIIVGDEDIARELRAQIIEMEADFYALARQHSIDAATGPAGGYLGVVRRKELGAAVEPAVFGARAGDIVGPVKTDEGWELIKVEALKHARLDAATREAIKSALFDEWLGEQRSKARISLLLLEPSPD